jgi:hypothetical protein
LKLASPGSGSYGPSSPPETIVFERLTLEHWVTLLVHVCDHQNFYARSTVHLAEENLSSFIHAAPADVESLPTVSQCTVRARIASSDLSTDDENSEQRPVLGGRRWGYNTRASIFLRVESWNHLFTPSIYIASLQSKTKSHTHNLNPTRLVCDNPNLLLAHSWVFGVLLDCRFLFLFFFGFKTFYWVEVDIFIHHKPVKQ